MLFSTENAVIVQENEMKKNERKVYQANPLKCTHYYTHFEKQITFNFLGQEDRQLLKLLNVLVSLKP